MPLTAIGTYKQWQDLSVRRDGLDTFLVNKGTYQAHRSFRVTLIISDGLASVALTMPMYLTNASPPFSTGGLVQSSVLRKLSSRIRFFLRAWGAREAKPRMEVVFKASVSGGRQMYCHCLVILIFE